MRRILHLHENSGKSGTENVIGSIIEHLDRTRYVSSLGCPSGVLSERVIGYGAEHIPFTFRLRRIKTPSSFPLRTINPFALLQKYRESFAIERIIRDHQIDILHTHSLSAHLAGLFAAKRAHRPILWHVHIYMPTILYRFMLPDLLIFVSEAVRRDAFAGTIPAKARTIYNGVDLAKFNPSLSPSNDIRQEFKIRPDQPLVALIGHIDPVKGQRELLLAWSQVLTTLPEAKLLLVGEPLTFVGPQYLAQLQQLIQQLGIEDSVIFTGFRSDIAAILHAVDVFVSFTVNDTLSVMVIEAMSMQKAIIGANSGGLPELIHTGETGLLVNNGDINGLANAIKTLLTNPKMRIKFGNAARQDAISRFDLSNFITKIQASYDELF